MNTQLNDKEEDNAINKKTIISATEELYKLKKSYHRMFLHKLLVTLFC